MSERTYKINEVFYSLQGEGSFTGHAAVFVRFSGCNLKCPFCDTDFKSFEELTAVQLLRRIEPWKRCKLVVLTGGEPTLQVDDALVDTLHSEGWQIAMETNGTNVVPKGVDWVTVSPKDAFVKNGKVALNKASEVKVVFDGTHEVSNYGIETEKYYLQPCDTGDVFRNRQILDACVRYIQQHPQWRLSLQTQKIINVR